MNRSRRAFLAAGATGAFALSAGCLDFLTGNGPLEFAAERAAPTDAALEETSFEEYEIREETAEETIEQAGVERDVEASYWISAYTREIRIGDEPEEGAGFVAVSTPDASVAGRSFNPVADMDSDEIIETFGAELEDQDFGDVTHEETTSLTILGDDRDVDRYLGQREYEGEPIEVEILVSSFDHEDDYLVVLGTYPRMESLRAAIDAVYGDAEGEPEGENEGETGQTEDEQGDPEDDQTEQPEDEQAADEQDGADEKTADEIKAELPDDLDESVETLFQELEHPV